MQRTIYPKFFIVPTPKRLNSPSIQWEWPTCSSYDAASCNWTLLSFRPKPDSLSKTVAWQLETTPATTPQAFVSLQRRQLRCLIRLRRGCATKIYDDTRFVEAASGWLRSGLSPWREISWMAILATVSCHNGDFGFHSNTREYILW